jgi:orotate phosphoribosyltransferase
MDLAKRIKQCAQLSGDFVLRSGQVSHTYFDKYRFEANPQLLQAIAQAMATLVPVGTEVLAGLEMGGIPVVTMLSQVTGLPAAFIRKQPKEYGTCRYAEGASLVGKQFILVEDVVSSGGAILDAVGKLQADGLGVWSREVVVHLSAGRWRRHYGKRSTWQRPHAAANSSRTPKVGRLDPGPGRPVWAESEDSRQVA